MLESFKPNYGSTDRTDQLPADMRSQMVRPVWWFFAIVVIAMIVMFAILVSSTG